MDCILNNFETFNRIPKDPRAQIVFSSFLLSVSSLVFGEKRKLWNVWLIQREDFQIFCCLACDAHMVDS